MPQEEGHELTSKEGGRPSCDFVVLERSSKWPVIASRGVAVGVVAK